MNLIDAAIWDIEMGDTARPSPPPTVSPERAMYADFEPVFIAMPWLHKARLAVVDFQHSASGSPDWVVLSDLEYEDLYLLISLGENAAVSSAVVTATGIAEPGTMRSPEVWVQPRPFSDARQFLTAAGSSWGGGRHV